MKANILFQKDIYDDDVHCLVVYADKKVDLLAVVNSLSYDFVLSNVYISDNKKEDN